jgi:acetyl esterase/lipase
LKGAYKMASQESLLIRQFLKQSTTKQTGEFNLEKARQGLEKLSGLTQLDSDITVEKLLVEGIPAEWVFAPNAESDKVFLYLHGGAYIMGSLNTHRNLVAKLSRSTGMRVLVIDYRLAPEHPYPAAVEDAVCAYRWLLSSGFAHEKIVIGGDSAGGGLTLAALLSLKDAGTIRPATTILLSPWTDLEGTGESMVTRKELDPWLSPDSTRAVSAMYSGEHDLHHPLISPIYSDLTDLPPMLIHVGNDEILLDDSIRLAERAKNAGVDVTLKVWDDMWHVFHTFPIPEAKLAIDEIGEYVIVELEKVKS